MVKSTVCIAQRFDEYTVMFYHDNGCSFKIPTMWGWFINPISHSHKYQKSRLLELCSPTLWSTGAPFFVHSLRQRRDVEKRAEKLPKNCSKEVHESDFARAAAAGKGDLALAAAGPVTAGI